MRTHPKFGLLGAAAALALAVAVPLGGRAEGGASEEEGTQPVSCATLRSAAEDEELEEWIAAEGDVAKTILEDPESFRAQVLVREVVPRESAPDCIVRRAFRVDAEYVYPASAIKTIAAVGAFRVVNTWNRLGKRPELGLDSSFWVRRPENFEELPSTSFFWREVGTLRHLVERMLVVSSNHDFNYLYDLVGHEALNRWMWEAGLDSVRLQHRMYSKRTVSEQKWTFQAAVEKSSSDAEEVVRQRVRPIRRSPLEVPEMPVEGVEVGETHTDFVTGEFRDEPMDFSTKNYISIEDLQRMMVALYRPELSDDVAFRHLGDFRPFLTEVLGRHPEEESEEKRGELVARFSPMLPGVREVLDRQEVVYHNKAGKAYGFHVDNAHIANGETGREVFVTAAVYVNENGRVNDDEYEYEKMSAPFLAAVGRGVARHLLAESR